MAVEAIRLSDWWTKNGHLEERLERRQVSIQMLNKLMMKTSFISTAQLEQVAIENLIPVVFFHASSPGQKRIEKLMPFDHIQPRDI